MPQKSLQNYVAVLENIKKQIRESRLKAALAVNCELIKLYWKIGVAILEKQKISKWGDKILENLSRDLSEEFPDMKEFSKRNIFYMRRFAEIYPDFQFVQQAAAQIPWFHNVAIMQATPDKAEREFYIRETIENGWSRNVLEIQIQAKLFQRQGKAVTNFKIGVLNQVGYILNPVEDTDFLFSFLDPATSAG